MYVFICNIIDTEQGNSEEYLLHGTMIDEDTPDTSSSPLKKTKNDKIDNKMSGLSEVQISLIDVCKKGKELGVKMENVLAASIEEENRSPSNKENQTLNVISPALVAKSIQPTITTLPSLSTDNFTSSANVHKTVNEEENRPVLYEVSLDKRLHSRESTEATIKHSTLQDIDSNEEKMDISINSLSLNLSDNKSDLDNSLKSDTSEKQSSNHDVDGEPSIDNTNKLLLLENKSIEIIDEVINIKEMSIENKNKVFEDTVIEISNKSDKTEDLEKSNETNKMLDLSVNVVDKCDSKESLILLQTPHKNIKVLEKRRLCLSKNEVSSILDQSIGEYTKQLSNDTESLPPNDENSEDNQSTVIQSIVSRDNVSDNFFKEKQETLHEQSDRSYAFSEIINSSSKNLNADNAIQDNQPPDIPKTFEKSVTEIAEDTSDADIDIELFQDVPTEK